MQSLSALSSVISEYDALLLDLWGVVHDGSRLYPGVHEALIKLRQADKKIIMLSNAPRRADKTVAVLTRLGIGPELYDSVVTSGELGYRWLQGDEEMRREEDERSASHLLISLSSHPRYYYIGPPKDIDILDGLDYTRSDDIENSDFLLNVGFGSDGESVENWDPLLQAASRMELPMLCLNPDFEVVKMSGERYACAGVLAMDYERFGGRVKYFGKPFPEVYEHCLNLLFPSPSGRGAGGEGGAAYAAQQSIAPPSSGAPRHLLPEGEGKKSRILAIGDGIATDIAGAVNFGIDAALVTGGIIKKDKHKVEELCHKHNAMPKYVMPQLAW